MDNPGRAVLDVDPNHRKMDVTKRRLNERSAQSATARLHRSVFSPHFALHRHVLSVIGTAADIIEFFDSFKDDKIAEQPVLVLLTLAIW